VHGELLWRSDSCWCASSTQFAFGCWCIFTVFCAALSTAACQVILILIIAVIEARLQSAALALHVQQNAL
jgi:hypothetical protein